MRAAIIASCLILTATASAHETVIVGDLVVIASGTERAGIPNRALRLVRNAVRRVDHGRGLLRYVDGPWEDQRAGHPDVIVFWGARRTRCEVHRGRMRHAFLHVASGTDAEMVRAIERRLFPCVMRIVRRVRL